MRNGLALLTAALLCLGAAQPALAASFEGEWHSATGESRYRLEPCGDGTQLCAKLIWLEPNSRPDAYQYLNQYVVDRAQPTGEDGVWSASINLIGHWIHGTIRMVDENTIKVAGCAYVVFCTEALLNRAN